MYFETHINCNLYIVTMTFKNILSAIPIVLTLSSGLVAENKGYSTSELKRNTNLFVEEVKNGSYKGDDAVYKNPELKENEFSTGDYSGVITDNAIKYFISIPNGSKVAIDIKPFGSLDTLVHKSIEKKGTTIRSVIDSTETDIDNNNHFYGVVLKDIRENTFRSRAERMKNALEKSDYLVKKSRSQSTYKVDDLVVILQDDAMFIQENMGDSKQTFVDEYADGMGSFDYVLSGNIRSPFANKVDYPKGFLKEVYQQNLDKLENCLGIRGYF